MKLGNRVGRIFHMPVDIGIVTTTLGSTRHVAIHDHKSRGIAFHAFPCTRFGFPLSLAEFKKTNGDHYSAFYAATEGRFPGQTPTAMLFGIVLGHDEALLYDRFGLAAQMTSGKPKVIRKKIRIMASLGEIQAVFSDLPAEPLDPISGKTITCPACSARPIELMSFLDEWKRSGCSYIQMILCKECADMVSGREWLGSVLCRNCGSRVKESATTCNLCGKYPFAANLT